MIGFAFPTLRPEQIKDCVPSLLKLISDGKVKIFANNSFPLSEASAALAALSSRRTIGKIILIP
jgi:NADPH:quinone reductase